MQYKANAISILNKRNRFLGGMSKADYINLTCPAIVNTRYQDEGKTAIIDINGFIGRDLFREMITGEKSQKTVENIRGKLREISSQKIIVNINSPGGDLNDGLVIADMLLSKQAEIVTNLQGFSASAATVIGFAGSNGKRRMSKNAFELLHRVMFGVMGYINQNTMAEMEKDLQVIDERIIKFYAERSNLTTSEIAKLMDEGGGYGRWISAEDALKYGFIDEIYDPADEDDKNIDRMEPEDRQAMKKNVEALARAGARSASNTDRQARLKEVERLKERESNFKNSTDLLPHVKSIGSSQLAYHEAGHAIIGVALGKSVTELKLSRKPAGGRAGYCLFERGSTAMRDAMQPWQYLAVFVAGSVADYGFAGHYMKDFNLKDLNGDPDSPASDKYHVNKLLEEIPHAARDKAVSNGIYFAASRLMRNWHHVVNLADNLNEAGSMNADEFTQWFNTATRHNKFNY